MFHLHRVLIRWGDMLSSCPNSDSSTSVPSLHSGTCYTLQGTAVVAVSHKLQDHMSRVTKRKLDSGLFWNHTQSALRLRLSLWNHTQSVLRLRLGPWNHTQSMLRLRLRNHTVCAQVWSLEPKTICAETQPQALELHTVCAQTQSL